MKRFCLLLLTAAIWSTNSRAQELGFRFAAAVGREALGQKDLGDDFRYYRSAWNLSPGIYYQQQVCRGLGLSTGVNYLRFGRVDKQGIFTVYSSVRESYDIVEVPLFLTLDCWPGKRPWNVRTFAGYSVGGIVAAQGFGADRYWGDAGEYQVSARRLSAYHFFNAGFEVGHKWRSGLTASLGLQGRWGGRTESLYEQYKVSDVCLVFKTGFLKSKK